MESELLIKSPTGDSVTTLVRVQKTGRVTVSDCLAAMNVPADKWDGIYLQIHVMLLPDAKE